MKKILSLLLLLCVHSAYGWVGVCENQSLGTGFYLGLDGSFGSFDFHLSEDLFQNRTSNPLLNEHNYYDSDTFQMAQGGGYFVGYGKRFCDRYRVALQFDANWYGGEAKHSYNYADVGEMCISTLQCKHLYDLTLKPGVTIGECLLFNFQCGVSFAGLRHTSLLIEDDVPNHLLDRASKNYHRVGYVLGAGIQVALGSKFSAVAEYSWHKFSVLQDVFVSTLVNTTLVSNTSELTNLSASLFKFGLVYKL